MKWRPKIVYNAVTLNFSVSQRPWTPGEKRHGGYGVSGAGFPESYTQRRDQLVRVILRFYESEYAAVMTWLAWSQDNAGVAFSFFPDRDVVQSYSVYLEEPIQGGEAVFPARDASFARVWEMPVTFRTTNAARFTTAYLP